MKPFINRFPKFFFYCVHNDHTFTLEPIVWIYDAWDGRYDIISGFPYIFCDIFRDNLLLWSQLWIDFLNSFFLFCAKWSYRYDGTNFMISWCTKRDIWRHFMIFVYLLLYFCFCHTMTSFMTSPQLFIFFIFCYN